MIRVILGEWNEDHFFLALLKFSYSFGKHKLLYHQIKNTCVLRKGKKIY